MEEETTRAYRWALKALTRRDHSVHEVAEGLRKKGWSRETAAAVTGRLLEQGYLDDGRFASLWVRSRSEIRLYGPVRLRDELRRKGVTKELVESALAQELSPAREEELALRAGSKRKRHLSDGGGRGRATLYRYLMNRGFSTGAVWKAIDSLFGEEITD